MGGQFEYFGLWLDSEFGPGHSKARPKCTTYGNPQLSASEEFQIEEIEVWGVGVPPEQEVRCWKNNKKLTVCQKTCLASW